MTQSHQKELTEVSTGHHPHPRQSAKNSLIHPGTGMGQTPEKGDLGGCVGTDQKTGQKERQPGCEDPEEGTSAVRRDRMGLSIKLPHHLTAQVDQSEELLSGICTRSKKHNERKCLGCRVKSFLR